MCVFEWFALFVENKAPVYTGPAQPGEQLPAFATTLADGKAFTNTELKNGSGISKIEPKRRPVKYRVEKPGRSSKAKKRSA